MSVRKRWWQSAGLVGLTVVLLTLAACGEGGSGSNGDTDVSNGPDAGETGETEVTLVRVSVDNNGGEAAVASSNPSISGDGRLVAFESRAVNLAGDDPDPSRDIYVHDHVDGETIRVNLDSDNQVVASRASIDPSMSANGRYVAFTSDASLEADHPPNLTQIYVRDLQQEDTFIVSRDASGTPASVGGASSPSISADGEKVAYTSFSEMVAGEGSRDVGELYITDWQTGETVWASRTSGGDGLQAGSALAVTWDHQLSGDGRHVVFVSNADNVGGVSNGVDNVFVHDTTSSETTRVSVASDGSEGDGPSGDPSISADGRYVAFSSTSRLTERDDTLTRSHVYVRDRQEETTERIVIDFAPAPGSSRCEAGASSCPFDSSSTPSISADGRYLAVEVREGSTAVVFWHDRQTGVSQRISESVDGEPVGAETAVLSADGTTVAFASDSSRLLDDITNEVADIFVGWIDQ